MNLILSSNVLGDVREEKVKKDKFYVIETSPVPPRTAKLRDYLKALDVCTELGTNHKINLNAMNVPPKLDNVHLRLEYVQDTALYRYIYDFVQENKPIWERGHDYYSSMGTVHYCCAE